MAELVATIREQLADTVRDQITATMQQQMQECLAPIKADLNILKVEQNATRADINALRANIHEIDQNIAQLTNNIAQLTNKVSALQKQQGLTQRLAAMFVTVQFILPAIILIYTISCLTDPRELHWVYGWRLSPSIVEKILPKHR